MYLIGSEMIHPAEKLANDHANDTQLFGLANQTSELFDDGIQTRSGSDLESFACKLIELSRRALPAKLRFRRPRTFCNLLMR